jgi:hypothetical protein
MYPKLCMTAYKSTRLLVMVFLFVFKSNSIIAFLLLWSPSQRYRACLENELGIQSRVCLFLECFDSGFVGEVFVKVRISDVVFV